jgi:hypothetical protein
MLILPNEWILDYLTPGTSKPHISEAFVKACRERNCNYLIRRAGNFSEKLFRYSKLYPLNGAVRRFVNMTLRDFTMVRIVEEHEIRAEGQDLSTIPLDDRYLVEVLYSFPMCVLISTDAFLVEKVTHLNLRAILFHDDVNVTLQRAEEMV